MLRFFVVVVVFIMTYLHKDKETLLPALPNILAKSPQIPVKTLSTHKETKASRHVITETNTDWCTEIIILLYFIIFPITDVVC